MARADGGAGAAALSACIRAHRGAIGRAIERMVLLLMTTAGAGAPALAQERPVPNATSEPYVLRDRATVVVQAGEDYGGGSFKRWLFGPEYRDVWTMPLEVPVIDLEETAGGLTPIERGGGKQTVTLHLRGGDGHEYIFRSVNKTTELFTPEGFRGTFVQSILQDQISSLNPLGSEVIPPLARAAGILHTRPTLVVVPDSPLLGEYRDDFAGVLVHFERKPDEDQSEAAHFGFSENVVGTDKLFEELREDQEDHVDARAFARARLFDMLVGDMDRHGDQWRWAEFESDDGTRYVPVARDRDFAFAKYDGFMLGLARLSGTEFTWRLVDFDEDMPDVIGVNWLGSALDRRLTAELTRDDWLKIADSLEQALPGSRFFAGHPRHADQSETRPVLAHGIRHLAGRPQHDRPPRPHRFGSAVLLHATAADADHAGPARRWGDERRQFRVLSGEHDRWQRLRPRLLAQAIRGPQRRVRKRGATRQTSRPERVPDEGEIGVFGFVDQGRVWADDEDSDRWHRGYGAGLWFTPFHLAVVTAGVTLSEPGRALDVSFGFQY